MDAPLRNRDAAVSGNPHDGEGVRPGFPEAAEFRVHGRLQAHVRQLEPYSFAEAHRSIQHEQSYVFQGLGLERLIVP
jgi:hypothetical protein